MPLLSPFQIEEVLKESGIKKVSTADKSSIKEILDSNNLSLDDLIGSLSFLIENGSSDTIRIRAAELAFKLHGALEESKSLQIPTFNIIINDTQHVDVNPILIPR